MDFDAFALGYLLRLAEAEGLARVALAVVGAYRDDREGRVAARIG